MKQRSGFQLWQKGMSHSSKILLDPGTHFYLSLDLKFLEVNRLFNSKNSPTPPLPLNFQPDFSKPKSILT